MPSPAQPQRAAQESPPHTAAARETPGGRSAGILISIRGAFAARGFEGTSMNDLARAAGMSVGNFYRYFPSKSAIVEALVAQDIADIEAQFQVVLAAPDKMAALRIGIARYLDEMEPDDCRLTAEISATALRQSEISSACQRMEEAVAALLLEAFALISGLTPEACRETWGSHARYIVLVIRGFGQRSDLTPAPVLTALILRGINEVLDDIRPDAADGTSVTDTFEQG